MQKLSKSDFLDYLKHPAWLWLKHNRRDVLPELTAGDRAQIAAGRQFEEIAETLFPNAIKIEFDNTDDFEHMLDATQQAISDGVKVLLQGRFETEKFACISDVVEFNNDGTVNLYEIKAATSVKKSHERDLAFQKIVLEQSGFTVAKTAVVHVNRGYIRNDTIDIQSLCVIAEITQTVNQIEKSVLKQMGEAWQVLESTEMPNPSPALLGSGNMAEWLEIYQKLTDEFSEDSIYKLVSVRPQGLRELEALDITDMKSIPDEFRLNARQERQVAAVKADAQIIDTPKVVKFLDKLEFPLYFLDYETAGSFLPPYSGLHPYDQLPFQYSLHKLETPDGELQHMEYLHTSNTKPSQTLAEQLVKDIGAEGTILVWYDKFEKSCNTLLAKHVPELAEPLWAINERIIDLMTPFSKGWFVDKHFYGSASIKKVLPALVPELSYKELNISEGGSAQQIWMDTFLYGNNQENAKQIEADLLEYCGLDTLAMVEIWRVLLQQKNLSLF